MMDHLHQSHPEIIKRLRRAEGHLHKVIGMIEDGRSCLDLALLKIDLAALGQVAITGAVS